MRILCGRSRYNLAYCRRLSLLDRSATSAADLEAKQPEEISANPESSDEELDQPSSDSAVTLGDSHMFSGTFADLGNIVSDRVIRSLQHCGFVKTTRVQHTAIPQILAGSDVLIRSATGSGKTLTFLVPALQRLVQRADGSKISRQDGTIVMIICPTRELSEQTKDTASKLSRPFPWIVVATIKGGDSRKSEKAQIRKGITLLVGTPGRVLDHCEKTSSFNVANIEMFVLDEADRLLDMGFETKIRSIYKFLASKKGYAKGNMQTVMTSATLTEAVRKLANFCLRNNPTNIGIEDDILSLPSTLTHEYVLVECKDKLICLISLLLKYVDSGEKVIVFVSNCQSVIFFHHLLRTLTWPTIEGFKKSRNNHSNNVQKKMESYSNIIEDYEMKTGVTAGSFRGAPVQRPSGLTVFNNVNIFMLHGNMEANDRTGYISDFMAHKSAILISTDVASRGLNLSEVNRVIQYDPPQQLEEYIHRSGRTARLGGKGTAILILMQHEVHFTDALRKRGVALKQVMEGLVWSYIENTYVPRHLRTFKGYNIPFLRNCFSDLVASEPELLSAAQGAFRSSVQSYKSYARDLRRIFDFKKLHLGHYATSFCLKQKPSDIMHGNSKTKFDGPTKGMPKKMEHKKINNKRQRAAVKAPKPERAPKYAPLAKAASQAAMQALEAMKARNQVLNKP